MNAVLIDATNKTAASGNAISILNTTLTDGTPANAVAIAENNDLYVDAILAAKAVNGAIKTFLADIETSGTIDNAKAIAAASQLRSIIDRINADEAAKWFLTAHKTILTTDVKD